MSGRGDIGASDPSIEGPSKTFILEEDPTITSRLLRPRPVARWRAA